MYELCQMSEQIEIHPEDGFKKNSENTKDHF